MQKDKRYLVQCILTTVDTVAVGALNDIEQEFGHLWGFRLHDKDKTDEQRELSNVWSILRKKILERGANSKEIALENIAPLTVKRQRYFHDFRKKD